MNGESVLKLIGKLVKETKIIKEAFVEQKDESVSFHDQLEECLVNLCKELEISVPIWLKKNTTEFGAFHKTFFSNEQFIDKVKFDRFEIRIEQ
ncbi:MAG TPA: hypothetical protein VHT34_07040 [Clostridia bacterium]|nr:hypothetical protein [Clostridia bacterium]